MTTSKDLRSCCCWKGCTSSSSIIYKGVGLCDEHWSLAGSTFKSTDQYALPRLTPEAANELRQHISPNPKTEEHDPCSTH